MLFFLDGQLYWELGLVSSAINCRCPLNFVFRPGLPPDTNEVMKHNKSISHIKFRQ